MWSRFLLFLKAPVFPDEEKTRRAQILNALHINLAMTVLILGVLGTVFVFPEKLLSLAVVVAGVGLTVFSMVLSRRGRVQTASLIMLVGMWGLTVGVMVISGGMHSLQIIFFIPGTVLAGVALGVKLAYVYALVSLLTGLFFILIEAFGITLPHLYTFSSFSAWIVLFMNLVFTVVPLRVALQTLAKTLVRSSTSEERYRLIASLMSDYVFSVTYNAAGNIEEQWISGAFAAITGYTPEAYFARGGWTSILHPDDWAQDAQDMALLRANQRVVTQVRIVRKDGAIRWVRAYAHPKWDEQHNQLAGIYGAVQDISEQIEIETSLRQREAILEVVADAANTFLKIPEWYPDVWDTEVNRLLERLGTTIKASHAYLFENHALADGSPGLSIRYEWTAPGFSSDLDDPRYQNMRLIVDVFELWNERLFRGEPYIGDTRHLEDEELEGLKVRGIDALLDMPIYVDEHWWGIIGFDEMTRPREWSNAEVGALTVAANLLGATIKRRQLDAMLHQELKQRKTLIDELETKNAELERFTYTVSHDLRSPLITIKGFLGYLEKDITAGNMAAFQKDIGRIGAAADRMDDLLRDLLELSRVGRVVNLAQKIPLTDIVQQALELVHGRLEQRGIRVIVQPNLPIVEGDKPRLVEVLQNLIDNAAKYMGDQAAPLIEIGQAGVDEADQPIFFVRDNGMGIDPQYHERIFGLFDKLDASSEGTGVGLALVKRIVEFHRGRIWVESPGLGHGATFYFTLQNTGK